MLSGELLNLSTHRKVAKIGMSVTLAATCATALAMKNSKAASKIHVISGWAFVGFSLYHAGLYDNGIFKNMIIKAQKERAAKLREKQIEPTQA